MDCEVRSERDHNFRPRAATEWGTRSAVARGDVGEIQGEDGRLRVAGEGSHKKQTSLHKLRESDTRHSRNVHHSSSKHGANAAQSKS